MRNKACCCFLGLFVYLLSLPLHSFSYVQSESFPGRGDHWPESEVTIALGFGCPENPLTYLGPCWDNVAQQAATAWNAVGQFRFHTQLASVQERESCFFVDVNIARWTLPACDEQLEESVLAITFIGTREGAITSTSIFVNHMRSWSTYPGPLRGPRDFYRIILHEFGHVLGLAHPDDHGQRVRAVMNAKTSDIDCLQSDDIAGVQAIYGSKSGVMQGLHCGGEDRATVPPPANAAAFALGNPTSGSIKSGVHVVSGWVCDAEELEASFDGGARLFVPYGSERPDTAGVCGDTDNGFGLLWNYNELGDGPHTVTLYIDGRVATRVNFTVRTLGTNFLRGVTGQGTIALSDGKRVTVQWEETAQGFMITGYTPSGPIDPGGGGSSSAEQQLRGLIGTWDLTLTVPGEPSLPRHYVVENVQKIDADVVATGSDLVDGSTAVILFVENFPWAGQEYAFVLSDVDRVQSGYVCGTYIFNQSGNRLTGLFEFVGADGLTFNDCDYQDILFTGTFTGTRR